MLRLRDPLRRAGFSDFSFSPAASAGSPDPASRRNRGTGPLRGVLRVHESVRAIHRRRLSLPVQSLRRGKPHAVLVLWHDQQRGSAFRPAGPARAVPRDGGVQGGRGVLHARGAAAAVRVRDRYDARRAPERRVRRGFAGVTRVYRGAARCPAGESGVLRVRHGGARDCAAGTRGEGVRRRTDTSTRC